MTTQFDPTVFQSIKLVRIFIMGLFVCVCLSGQIVAQGADDEEEPNIPEPETITLTTTDGVILKCTWYAKPNDVEGKKTTPVVMVHRWGGKRSDFNVLAVKLQAAGRAVILPDLRGHGESTTYKLPNGEVGDIKKPDKMRTADVANSVRYDLGAVKRFLQDKNNEGELNLDQLVMIGSETSAPLIMNWTARDAMARPLTIGKQGQFVRAMILLSPDKACEGVLVKTALQVDAVKRTIAAQFIVGRKDSRTYKDVRRMYGSFEGYRSKNTSKNLYIEALDTSLQGTRMLEVKTLLVPERINAFIKKLVDEEAGEHAWEERKSLRAH